MEKITDSANRDGINDTNKPISVECGGSRLRKVMKVAGIGESKVRRCFSKKSGCERSIPCFDLDKQGTCVGPELQKGPQPGSPPAPPMSMWPKGRAHLEPICSLLGSGILYPSGTKPVFKDYISLS